MFDSTCVIFVVVILIALAFWIFHPGGRKQAKQDYNQLAKDHGHRPYTPRDIARLNAEEREARNRILPPGSEEGELH